MQRAEQEVGQHVGVGLRPLRRDEAADVAVPEPVDRVLVAFPGRVVRRGGQRGGGVGELCHQALVAADHSDDRVQEGEQPLAVRGTVAQRRRPGRDRLLQRLGALHHERVHQAHPVAEPVEDGPLAHARGLGDLLHRDVPRSVRGQEPLRGGQDRAPVAGRVGPLGLSGTNHDDALPVDKWTGGPVR